MRFVNLRDGRCFTGHLFGYQYFEVTARRPEKNRGLYLSASLRSRGDHPGFNVFIGVGRFTLEFAIYDVRHADVAQR